ncbi:cytochrome bd ubiquinol oxidase subunit I [Segniliparus rotundus DSM 44985]|uniref:Cytochrome bd ubiquinol oxidase subunit I n=1 Tax=Segniliparus rotundus (strain ATCC BAA-972 / CDC 1076 / CIP 108378 / DSM 44985 / JCM 13578) TaxID=640132 RepID=D6ZFJ0_SEGRD|nr:cytochrome ubiquinol oxidase subunit I [Segniliparus rotundus]ADG97714.1 cytochrome bd ubiquinol oxidase subunit I [Segniliparus rotundus DSM 44985]
MTALDVARWQFGITTVYHFLLVPLTIGLAPLIALMQTIWNITADERWYRATKFFGKLFLINFALGVATGIVQEFQFGLNWSEYSRFVGDVFGAPLALEGIVAFFMESTFLGLWIFGWDRLPRGAHLACAWMVALGTNASAYFIIAANSFMQHPVGVRYNPQKRRAELTSIWELLTNNTTLAAFPHTVAGSFLTAGTFVAGIGSWWLVREKSGRGQLLRPAVKLGLWTMVAAGAVLAVTGDVQGKLMFQQQPMKMASAESLCRTETDPDFSVLTTGTHNNCASISRVIEVPYALPYLAKGKFSGVTLAGVENLQQDDVEKYGPGNYRPNLFVAYWAFRAMIGWALGSAALALVGLWATRGGRTPPNKTWFRRLALWSLPTPFLANSAGWVFTEMGRQPWVVAPNPTGVREIHLTVQQAVSGHSAAAVAGSLVFFTLLYGFLAIVWFGLMRRYALEGPSEHDAHPPGDRAQADEDHAPKPLSFAY